MVPIAVTAFPYGQALLALGTGGLNLTSDTLKVALVQSAYSPNVDTDTTYAANISGSNEFSSTGYTAGGATLTGTTLTYDAANNWAALAAANVTWSGVTGSARYAVVYKSSTGVLIGYIDFGETKTFSAEDFQLTFTNGVLRLKLPA